MSKTIVGKILASLWSVFKKNFPKYIADSYDKIEPELRQEISWITQIVSKLNDLIQDPTLDIVTLAIPGVKDDEFLKWARIATPRLLLLIKGNLSNPDKAIASASLVQGRTGMKLSQALITSQVVYEKENK